MYSLLWRKFLCRAGLSNRTSRLPGSFDWEYVRVWEKGQKSWVWGKVVAYVQLGERAVRMLVNQQSTRTLNHQISFLSSKIPRMSPLSGLHYQLLIKRGLIHETSLGFLVQNEIYQDCQTRPHGPCLRKCDGGNARNWIRGAGLSKEVDC
ncbi:hypothetical protein BDZ94DRAFT_1269708 [Collybia nuda]|uniref:Uncharacterized protein n=1 Tax=Collybia nuda TaxID=64659 RepID=A0A9P6CF92_9AGAR|nr:hypothetical protein BDZ94DRAFT_1269708 [Collybia nuda]